MSVCCVQTAAAAHEVVPVVPPADPPQRAHLPAVQGQEPLAQPQEAQEEIVAAASARRQSRDMSHADARRE